MKKFFETKTFHRLLLILALTLSVRCNDYEHAPHGESDLGGTGIDGSNNDDDDNTQDTDSDNDTDTDELICEDDEVLQPGTTNCWRRCPAGQEWNSKVCEGVLSLVDWQDAQSACGAIDSTYDTATLSELVSVLGGCDKQVSNGSEGYCDYCSVSLVCGEMFEFDSNTYWTSTVTQEDTDTDGYSDLWTVSFENGMVLIAYYESQLHAVRCLRSL